ncbi:MAG: 4-hydroxy-3-methylbut-2-enyl diphosphate reductase [Smithella sp.]
MEVKLARTAGFCMGVRRAVDIVLEMAQHETGRHIYTYGPLIHSPQTIELLKSRGIMPVKSLDEISDCQNSVLIIRAHGISPQERKKIKASGIKIVDATCPKVGYVQAIIKKHAALNYIVIIIGDKEHPEVNGLLGCTEGRGITVATIDEVKELPELDKVCVVAQTTQNLDDYNKIVEKIMERFPDTIVFNTICSSTEQRQAEVIALSQEMDAMFIVGGKNSANTRRLAELAEKQQTPAFHIETVEELDNINLDFYNRIGVSAGASTPNWIIDQVMDKIAETKSRRLKKVGFFFNFWLWAIKTDIYSAIGAGCLSLACMQLQKIPIDLSHLAIASFFVYSMHVINRLISQTPGEFLGSFREETYLKHKKIYLLSAAVSLFLALLLALKDGLVSFSILSVISLTGVLYSMKILPPGWRFQSLKDLPGSKNIFTATAWGVVTAVLPAINEECAINGELAVAFIFTFGVVFIRSAMSDILEIQSDKLIGRETIPVLIGKDYTKTVLKIISLIILIILLASFLTGLTSSLSLILLMCILYIWICFQLCDRKSGLSGAFMEGLLETSYVIAGLCVFLWFVL